MADTRLASNTGLYPSSRLIGSRVEHPSGETLGVLEDFLIDLGEGCVAAAVLSVHATGGKQIAVPVAALGYDPVDCKCLLNWTRETLVDAPSYHGDSGRGPIDRSWIAELYTYFGGVPYWF